jgi:acyl-coenzyme A synthetase/AMP-(fatty) acid ligase
VKVFEPLSRYTLTALVADGEAGARSASDLLRAVHAVAARLPSRSTELLLCCQDRYHLAVALLAAWERNHVVALPPNARTQTLAELSLRCGYAVHDGNGVGDDMRAWLSAANHDEAHVLSPIAAERHVVTVYTSGSTGASGACPKSAAQLLGEGQTLQRTFQLAADSCVLATVPAHHIYGLLFSIVLPWAAGERFVRETPLHTQDIEACAQRFGADVLVSVPAHLHALAEMQLHSLGAVRKVFSSGAPLPDATALELHRRFGVEVSEVLGSTETGGFAFRAAEQPNATFRPFAGVEVAEGEDQQLLLRSPLLAAELEQPLACPDLIELSEDGSFRHLGRADGVIKVAGTRIALSELEARVRSLPGVLDAVVLAVSATHARQQELWLVVATEHGRALPELRSELLRYYEPVLLPRRVRFVAALPREATGKLPRERLLALFEKKDSAGPPP